ncbi:hypothetical protein [Brevibacterium renqingii]|uniref:hypothetical protein n=1 Tax=Brevibacterium renqingii TaxID=2776916 RepID=UPI001AE04CF5|nr:hypothetical protein [Brevibacterium renqingii]
MSDYRLLSYKADRDNRVVYFSTNLEEDSDIEVVTLHASNPGDPQINVDYVEPGNLAGIEILAYDAYLPPALLSALSEHLSGTVELNIENSVIYFQEDISSSKSPKLEEYRLTSSASTFVGHCLFTNDGKIHSIALPQKLIF